MAVTPKIRRTYKGASPQATLDVSGVTGPAQTSIALSASPTGWPTGKFFVVVAPGTAYEEKMCVTLSGATLTVVDPNNTSTAADADGRGVDDTTARSTIPGGSVVYPVFTARDADEANQLTSTYVNQGGIVYMGDPSFTQLAIGTAGQVLKVNSGATAPEWGQVGTAGIADDAVTLDKIADAVMNKLVPTGTITAYGGASAPTGWLLCDGSAINGAYTALIALVGANTPDLRGRFPMGKTASGTGSTLLGTGGSTTIAEGNLPSHSHGVGTLATNSTGSHSHSGTVDSAGGHSHTAASNDTGSHSHGAGTFVASHLHTISGKNTSSTSHTHTGTNTLAAGISGGTDISLNTAAETAAVTGTSGSAGSHSHSITVDSVGGHQHTFGTSTEGSHSHTISGSTATTGSGTAYFQPFVAVNYIIKHD